jgi:hypothetical protein
VLFRVAREFKVEPLEAEATASGGATIPTGEVVRLIPEFARETTAHVIWRDRRYTVDRSLFLSCASPLGPAPD